MRLWTRWLLSLLISSLLTATGCGGGSSTPATPADPTVPSPADPADNDPDPGPVTPAARDIAGRLITPEHLPVPGAQVFPIGGTPAVTDQEGRFSFSDLPGELTVLAISAPGFVPHTEAVPAGGPILGLEILLHPLPAEAVPPIALEATLDPTGATLAIPVPGLNLPYDYFVYRRAGDEPFDFSVPLNTEPLRPGPHDPNSASVGPTPLIYRDRDVVRGITYRYTVRLKDPDGGFSAPAPEVAVTPMGLGPATRIDGIPNLTLLDTAPGADGTLVALYRDTTYQPWHRFIARRFDGTGSSTELFRSEGVYDDARVFTDLNDVPYFMYRRNGIEFLFETFLLNSWDPATNSLSYDIRIGHSQRRIEGELSGAVHFRPDPEGRSPMETVAVYVNRDRQIVAQSWDAGTPPPQIELPIGAAPHTYKPRLDTLQNRAGNIAVIWNLDHAQPASFQVGFLLGNTVVPGTYLADGLGIGMRLGVTGRDEFLAAYTTEPVAGAIQVLRFNPSGQSDYLATVDLSALGASIPGDNNRLAFATLANGKTILLALIDTLGDRELHAWDITDLGAIEDLGPFALGAEVPPTSITVRPDRRGNLHVVTVEGGSTFHRRFYWPRS